MNQYQIFISYRRDGGDALAGRLADRFNALGYNVFYDVESMRSGTFNTQILDAIAQCDDVLLVLPPNSLDRCANADDWVRQELAFALKHNKNIIPIMMRGFEFPKKLPVDIDIIRNMEGVTASNEYFDAVIQRIQSLLSSSYNVLASRYSLDTKEYYKIQTPLFNIYKRNPFTPRGYLNVRVFLEKLQKSCNGKFHWSPPEWQSSQNSSLRDFWVHSYYPSTIKWYDENAHRLSDLRNKILELKQESDLYFYCNALTFTMGTMTSLWYFFASKNYRSVNYYCEMEDLLCYIMDLPHDQFDACNKAFNEGNCGYEEFRNQLPLALDVWPNMHNQSSIRSEDKQHFDNFAIMLFEYMVELSIFVIDNVKIQEHTTIKRSQIRCYYKWLKKNKLYLPKNLQERIYRYL